MRKTLYILSIVRNNHLFFTGSSNPGWAMSRMSSIFTMSVLLLLVNLTLPYADKAHAACDPAQFVGKMYSEGLGRGPDPSGYNANYNSITAQGCVIGAVANVIRGFYHSPEFVNKTVRTGGGVDWAGRILAAYRGILNREPDPGGYSNWHFQLNSGSLSWGSFVEILIASQEFANRYWELRDGAYGWGAQPVTQIDRYSSEETWSGSDVVVETDSQAVLQTSLNTVNPGDIVWLAPKQVVHLNSTLIIPAGVTLKTWGSPTPGQYTKMGRLVRASAFDHELVVLESGATMQYVAADGQRTLLGGRLGNPESAADGSILLKPGTASTHLEYNFLSNLVGSAVVKAQGRGQFPNGPACHSTYITHNVLTGYSTSLGYLEGDKDEPDWQDGITAVCENSVITHNQLLDLSDGGITFFARENPSTIFMSKIQHNEIILLNNRAVTMLVFGLQEEVAGASVCASPTVCSFANTLVQDNILWTGSNRGFPDGGYAHMAIMAGHGPWSTSLATDLTITNNTVPNGMVVRAETAVAIDGVLNANVHSNISSSQYILANDPISTCPSTWIGAHTPSRATGSFPGYVPAPYLLCAGSTPR